MMDHRNRYAHPRDPSRGRWRSRLLFVLLFTYALGIAGIVAWRIQYLTEERLQLETLVNRTGNDPAPDDAGMQ